MAIAKLISRRQADSQDARRLTPTRDITIAAVIAQEMTPALSPAPYDWLATATTGSHTACSHFCTLHIESTGRGVIELCTAFSRSLTCVEGRPHTKEEVPAQIKELQGTQNISTVNLLIDAHEVHQTTRGCLQAGRRHHSFFIFRATHRKADGSSCQGIGSQASGKDLICDQNRLHKP